MIKPRLGIFKFSCCSGCEFELFFFQPQIVEVLSSFDLVFCRLISSSGTPEGPFDLALVEGAVTESWQAEEIGNIRERSRLLYALGSCAVNGGIPAIKATLSGPEAAATVYPDPSGFRSLQPRALGRYARIDGSIRGCPPSRRELHEVLASALLGQQPELIESCVCVECKQAGHVCLLAADQLPCMGPVTSAGCGALCPGRGRACYSCCGPMPQANGAALARRFEALGLSRREIALKFSQFGMDSDQFRSVWEQYES